MIRIEEACVKGSELLYLPNQDIILDTAKLNNLQQLYQYACMYSKTKTHEPKTEKKSFGLSKFLPYEPPSQVTPKKPAYSFFNAGARKRT